MNLSRPISAGRRNEHGDNVPPRSLGPADFTDMQITPEMKAQVKRYLQKKLSELRKGNWTPEKQRRAVRMIAGLKKRAKIIQAFENLIELQVCPVMPMVHVRYGAEEKDFQECGCRV